MCDVGTDNKGACTGSRLSQWYVMRDLTRTNAQYPAYRMLRDKGMECFTPMTSRLSVKNGKRMREQVPFIHDLVFVYATREELDPIVERTPTLQYRFLRNTYRTPMTVREKEMNAFIGVVSTVETPQYYRPEEITADMYRRKIRIIGGQLEGYEGYLLSVRGSKTKRLLVELPTLPAASVEVEPEYIQLLNGTD